VASSGRECSEIGWAARSRGGNSPRLERGRKDLVAASEPGGFPSDAVGGRGENHLVPYMKKPIDHFRFEEYGDDVRGRPRLKENRGLASVDRITRCVTCVQGWCWRGWANNSRREGATIGPLRGHGAGGLPGPGSFQNALGAREEYSRVATNGCGLIRSGCEPVHRGCLRSSSKTLSRTREPLAVS
jgi:hypothetical protein